MLYEADQRGVDPLEVLAQRTAIGHPPVTDYARELVVGVAGRLPRLDELISTYAQGWTIDRMPAVDRNILRLGGYELLFSDDVPDAVAVDEAVDLARELSTDSSPEFVNGLLGTLLALKASLVGEPG